MKINPVTFIIIAAFVYPLAKGFLFKFSSNDLKRDIQEIEGNISFIISMFLGVYFSKKIFLEHDDKIYKVIYEALPDNILTYLDKNSILLYIIVIPIMIFCIYKLISLIFEGINYITFYPIADILDKFVKDKSNIFKRICGAVFQLPRAAGYVLFIVFLLNLLSMFNIGSSYNKYLESSKAYGYVCREVVIPVTNSNLAKQLPTILDNSFKVVVKEADVQNTANENGSKRVIVYYNGVTLDEGVKSNAQIDSFAREIGSKGAASKDKARILYNWIGANISYDQNKANRVLNNDFNIKSGAIPTFQTREGICFDYACLYVAMARANGLKVRIITGEGFNGVSWVSHAWNEVFIPEENKWIKVDPTFYKGGNYFNSKRFDLDHRDAKIAGEW